MLELKTTQENENIPVTVLHLTGKLDGFNYGELITEAQKIYALGTRDLVLDLSQLSFLSSAGISALHRVALLFQGRQSAELEEGWAAFHAMERDRDKGVQRHVKLLKPSKEVQNVLDMVGFTAFFEIYTDIHSAVTSFHQ